MKANGKVHALLGCLALLLGLAGCGRDEDLSPPRIAYGQAECELCRMIVSEEPFAAAAVVRRSDGRIEKFAFDDIGCLLGYLKERPAGESATGYVHDYETRQWLEATGAVFVHSDNLPTPMASNLAALASRDGAESMLKRYPGSIISFARLRAGVEAGQPANELAIERSNP